MYACVLLAAIVQQSRGYLNPFFFFFDWAAAAGLGSSLFFYLARPVVFFAQMRSLFQPSAPIPPSCSSSHRPRFSPVEISFGTEYFSGRQSHGYSPARFSLSVAVHPDLFRSFPTELFCNYHNFNCRRTQHTITHLSLNVQPSKIYSSNKISDTNYPKYSGSSNLYISQ
jgi:hypothetical protein